LEKSKPEVIDERLRRKIERQKRDAARQREQQKKLFTREPVDLFGEKK